MEIYITGNLPKSSTDAGEAFKLQLPSAPEQIKYDGETRFLSYDILDRGEVVIPNGTELESISWEGTFYGEDRKNRGFLIGEWIDPNVLVGYFQTWKNYGVKLNVLITGFEINKYMYLKSFSFTPSGGFGDIQYSLELVDATDLVISSTTAASTTTKRTTKTNSKTYTVKKNDTVYKIAKKYVKKNITAYATKIYNKNKKVIEDAAKKHKRKSSQKGKYLYAGTKLTIP